MEPTQDKRHKITAWGVQWGCHSCPQGPGVGGSAFSGTGPHGVASGRRALAWRASRLAATASTSACHQKGFCFFPFNFPLSGIPSTAWKEHMAC